MVHPDVWGLPLWECSSHCVASMVCSSIWWALIMLNGPLSCWYFRVGASQCNPILSEDYSHRGVSLGTPPFVVSWEDSSHSPGNMVRSMSYTEQASPLPRTIKDCWLDQSEMWTNQTMGKYFLFFKLKHCICQHKIVIITFNIYPFKSYCCLGKSIAVFNICVFVHCVWLTLHVRAHKQKHV